MSVRRAPFIVDTLFINTLDVGGAVEKVRAHLGLAPFLSFELVTREGAKIPIVIFALEGGSLEILGRVEGARPGSGGISRVEIEAPVADRVEVELAPHAPVLLHPGPKPRFRAIQIKTGDCDGEARCLSAREDGRRWLGQVELQLIETPRESGAAEIVPTLYFPGWHRMSTKVNDLRQAEEQLRAAGLRSLQQPFCVLPGLDEAMLHTPSGLIVQITRERLWRMLPAMAGAWFAARLARRPMRFYEKPPS